MSTKSRKRKQRQSNLAKYLGNFYYANCVKDFIKTLKNMNKRPSTIRGRMFSEELKVYSQSALCNGITIPLPGEYNPESITVIKTPAMGPTEVLTMRKATNEK